jgi:hypothetical protein
VENDVYAVRGSGNVARIQHRAGLELDIETVEGLGQVPWLQDTNPMAHLDEPSHQNVAEAAAATCYECYHAAQ